ncbi:MAG: HNH endonuclease signature motif containing protein [Candidatus Polarisedimenticolia bacterium]
MSIARALGEIDPWLAAAAAAYKSDKVWWRHGFARLEDHCREVFHRSGRWLRDLAALGDAFKKEERLRAAFTGSDGGAPLGRCRAVLVARVATSRTLHDWIALARRCSVAELRGHVSRARSTTAAGAGPPKDDGERRLVDDEEPDTQERCRLSLQVPFPVAVAFDEGLELFRAVEGGEAPVTSYIEALMAEQTASGGAVECATEGAAGVERRPLERSGPVREQLEDRAAPELPRLGDEPSALQRADWALARFEPVRQSLAMGEKPDPADQIQALVALEDDLERRLGDILLGVGELRGWRRLGFGGAGHYAEQRLGVSRSWAEDRVRAARALRRYPRLREAYDGGTIGLEAVLKISCVLKTAPNPDDVVEAWVERAEECTVKRLRDESRELTRRRAGIFAGHDRADVERRAPLSDLSWFRSLERRAGTARRRIRQLAEMALSRPVADTTLVLRLPEEMANDFTRALRVACRTFSTAPAAWAGLLVLIDGFVETWDHDENDPRRPAWVTDTFIRFGWRCAAPGCTSRQGLQVHHVLYRSHGGGNEAENLVVACLFHHLRGEHGDLAACRGRSPLGVTWRLGSKDRGRHCRHYSRHYRNERRVARHIPHGM